MKRNGFKVWGEMMGFVVGVWMSPLYIGRVTLKRKFLNSSFEGRRLQMFVGDHGGTLKIVAASTSTGEILGYIHENILKILSKICEFLQTGSQWFPKVGRPTIAGLRV